MLESTFLKKLFIFNWRIIALHCLAGFCHISTRIGRGHSLLNLLLSSRWCVFTFLRRCPTVPKANCEMYSSGQQSRAVSVASHLWQLLGCCLVASISFFQNVSHDISLWLFICIFWTSNEGRNCFPYFWPMGCLLLRPDCSDLLPVFECFCLLFLCWFWRPLS